MSHPADVSAIINSSTNPEIAAEIYAASLLALAFDNAAEKAYLAMLACKLQLPPELVTELEHQIETQKYLLNIVEKLMSNKAERDIEVAQIILQ